MKHSGFLLAAAVFLAGLLALEAGVRAYSALFDVYDLEMWKYSRELKALSPDPRIRYRHRPNVSVTLESVRIRTNSRGLRGAELRVPPAARRILFLGGSTLLGWGVSESDTVSERLSVMFRRAGEDVEVLNGGIGNYNLVNTVEGFLADWADLAPQEIVLLLAPSALRPLPAEHPDFLVWNSTVAALFSTAKQRMRWSARYANLEAYYRAMLSRDGEVTRDLELSLSRLEAYAREVHVKLYFACLPETHDLGHYSLGFVHELLARSASRHGIEFVDLAGDFEGRPVREILISAEDNHLSAEGHRILAERLFEVLRSR